MKPKPARSVHLRPQTLERTAPAGKRPKQSRGVPESERGARWWVNPWLFGFFLVAAILAVYHPAWHGGFIWDDDLYVSNNPLLTAPDGLRRIWLSLDSPSQYFPLTYTVFLAERSLWGLDTAGYHWVNLLLHAANALLVWRVLKQFSVPGARLSALLFALHPVQVETVAWITELKNLLSLFFCLGSVLAWLRFVAIEDRGRWKFYVASLLLFLLALFSKSTACTLPAALFLILWLKRLPLSPRRLLPLAPYLALGLGMGLLAMWWEHFHQGTEGTAFGLGAWQRVLLANHALWFYAGKLLWPAHLAFSYPRWTIQASDPAAYIWPAATLAVGAGIYFWRRRWGRGPETAFIFYAATLSPMLGFIMLYTFEYSFVADHYQYVACIGPLALAAAGFTVVCRHAATSVQRLGPPLAGAVLLILGALTFHQSRAYADVETLWERTLANNPDSVLAHNNLGNLLLEQGKLNEAILHFKHAIEVRPDVAEGYSNLGNALAQTGEIKEALSQYEKALRLRTDLPEVHNNYANLLAARRRFAEAQAEYERAIALRPRSADTHNNLGKLFLEQGKVDEALPHLRKAVELRPDFAQAHNTLGTALLELRQDAEAEAQFRQALQLEPKLATAHNNLGTVLFRAGKLNDALAEFQQALVIRPNFAEAANNAGKALLSKGQPAVAADYFQKALTLRPDFSLARSNLQEALRQSQTSGTGR